ncbi:MAG: XdhC family protein [Gammaproteobacteria bacterium]|nr:XdhC family protein [Gammaproteobacteria bacterium]MDH4253031.1 XdhC family protein [Gammaproteobacteria bacterium]MDH5308547.1 XdhC family protein [Gammaproteobacteria bacterium]
MSNSELLNFFAQQAAGGRMLVLASVYETQGSTYSKTGARMLISPDGVFQGMLSGGCLEGDLAERAARVAASGQPEQVTYDLGLNDEELWGLGVGCDGLMRIFLQPLGPSDGYEPFATMARELDGDEAAVCATALNDAGRGPIAGASLVTGGGRTANFGFPQPWLEAVESVAQSALSNGKSRTDRVEVAGDSADILFGVLRPPPRVLVLGAGLDAQPVVRLCAELGWRVTVQDHRPAYVQKGDFSRARRIVCVPAEELPGALDLDDFDAAIIMSHHLATDRVYLRLVAETGMPYVGLLGPSDRRRRLVQELGAPADRLAGRLHGPAGLDIGGRGPGSIALSIVAEMHLQLIGGRDGY